MTGKRHEKPLKTIEDPLQRLATHQDALLFKDVFFSMAF